MNYNKAEFYTSYGTKEQIPESEKIEIVFAGKSNVGKSTLINKIFNRKSLARVSSVPGKTATINFYTLENVYFVDLPGYGYAKVAKTEKQRWSELIEGYFALERNIQMIFLLIDMRHAPSKNDMDMLNFLVDREYPFIVVFTKADKLNKTERIKRMEAFKTEIPYFDQIKNIPFSSQTFEGVEELRSVINEISEENIGLEEDNELEENIEFEEDIDADKDIENSEI